MKPDKRKEPSLQDNNVSVCLWFDDQALEAAQFYTSLIEHSSINHVAEQGEGRPPLMVLFNLRGVPFQALNGGPHFRFNEACSIVISTEGQQETDRLWEALTADGGSESRCGWLKDKFGLSWQIVPVELGRLLGSPDRDGAHRAMQAMLQMHKIEIALLQDAFGSSGTSI